MAGPVLKACKSCQRVFDDLDVCPVCNGQTTKEWQGLIVVLDPSRSEIAKRSNITEAGRYALKVR